MSDEQPQNNEEQAQDIRAYLVRLKIGALPGARNKEHREGGEEFGLVLAPKDLSLSSVEELVRSKIGEEATVAALYQVPRVREWESVVCHFTWDLSIDLDPDNWFEKHQDSNGNWEVVDRRPPHIEGASPGRVLASVRGEFVADAVIRALRPPKYVARHYHGEDAAVIGPCTEREAETYVQGVEFGNDGIRYKICDSAEEAREWLEAQCCEVVDQDGA